MHCKGRTLPSCHKPKEHKASTCHNCGKSRSLTSKRRWEVHLSMGFLQLFLLQCHRRNAPSCEHLLSTAVSGCARHMSATLSCRHNFQLCSVWHHDMHIGQRTAAMLSHMVLCCLLVLDTAIRRDPRKAVARQCYQQLILNYQAPISPILPPISPISPLIALISPPISPPTSPISSSHLPSYLLSQLSFLPSHLSFLPSSCSGLKYLPTGMKAAIGSHILASCRQHNTEHEGAFRLRSKRAPGSTPTASLASLTVSSVHTGRTSQ